MLTREPIGALIDAVYAIAATILALEIPAELGNEVAASNLLNMLVDYAITFLILFALWVQHRRINQLIDPYTTLGVWLNALALMLVCLIPRATMLVFEYGGDVTLHEFEEVLFHGAELTRAELVNVLFVVLVLGTDLSLLFLSRQAKKGTKTRAGWDVLRSKSTISILTIVVLLLSFLLSVEQRYFLFIMPLALMFERQLYRLFNRSQREPG